MKKCPYCAEEIQDDAVFCRYCGKKAANLSNIERLLKDLKSTSANVRYEACEILRVAPSIPKDALDALEILLNDKDEDVRDAAQRAILIHSSTTPATQSPSEPATPIQIARSKPSPSPMPVLQMPSSPPNSSEYIFALEKRIMYLEMEIANLRNDSSGAGTFSTLLASKLPNSNIISHSFVSRAFAVWGHYIVAQLIIAIPIYCIIFLISVGISP